MRKSWKAAVQLVSILSFSTGAVACSTPSGKVSQAQNGTGSEKAAQVTKYNIFFNRGETYPQDGGIGKKMILDGMMKAGIAKVDFNVTLASGDDYLTKLNLMASSGELPDYFNIDLKTLTKFAQEGLILPLNDYLNKMPNASKMFRPEDLQAATVNGKLYAFPRDYRPERINGQANGFLVRKDWLDKLGISMPNTLSELHDVLTAFTTKDPDGDGKKDTYGIGGVKPDNSTPTAGFDGIFGAFGIQPTYWAERNGVLKQGMVLPEMKQALQLLQQWYKEGLIDPDFVLTTGKQLDEKFVNSKVGVRTGAVWALSPEYQLTKQITQQAPNMSLKILPPPIGSNGQRGWPDSIGSGSTYYAISSKAKNPDLLVKMLDWSVSDAPDGGFMLLTYGIEGKDYTFDQKNNRINQTTSGSADNLTKIGLSNPVQLIKVVDNRWASEPILEGLQVTANNTIKNQFANTVPAQLQYPDINQLWLQYFVKIVTGTYTVDKWDEFVQKYYQQGGKLIEDQVNAERKGNVR